MSFSSQSKRWPPITDQPRPYSFLALGMAQGCGESAEEPPPPDPGTRAAMGDIAGALRTVLPLTLSEDRFADPAIAHRTLQVAMDGTQKLPQRVLHTIADRRAAGASPRWAALVVAAWMRYAQGVVFEVSARVAEPVSAAGGVGVGVRGGWASTSADSRGPATSRSAAVRPRRSVISARVVPIMSSASKVLV